MHEAAVSAVQIPLIVAINKLSSIAPMILHQMTLRSNQDIAYPNRKGSYIPDLALRVNRENVFQLEVAFAQSFEDVRSTMANRLQDESLLGVLVIKIHETTKYSSPTKSPTEEDDVPKRDWFAGIQREGRFGTVWFKERAWLHRIEVYVALFERGWKDGDDDPLKVRHATLSFTCLSYFIKHAIPENGDFSLSDIDTRLNVIWQSVTRQCIGQTHPNVQVEEFKVNWNDLRSLLVDAMLDTAHFRYQKWIRG